MKKVHNTFLFGSGYITTVFKIYREQPIKKRQKCKGRDEAAYYDWDLEMVEFSFVR